VPSSRRARLKARPATACRAAGRTGRP